MTNGGLIDRFVLQEVSPYVRVVLRKAFKEREISDNVAVRQFEFNCFDVALYFSKGVAVIEDVLGSDGESSVEMSISDFADLCSLDAVE